MNIESLTFNPDIYKKLNNLVHICARFKNDIRLALILLKQNTQNKQY